jgi:hypothetical protein
MAEEYHKELQSQCMSQINPCATQLKPLIQQQTLKIYEELLTNLP